GAGPAGQLATRVALREGARVGWVCESLPDGSIATQLGTVDALPGTATFVSSGELVAAGHPVTATSYVVATGSYPRRPELPGLPIDRVLTADDVPGLREIPRRLAVLGAGPSGLEIAQAFTRLGTQVTLLDTCPVLLPESAACG